MSSEQTNWHKVASTEEFSDVTRLKCVVEAMEILVFQVGNDYVSVKNQCTHLGRPLEKGRLMSGQLSCPFHGACFDIRTGKALSGPAVIPLTCYPTKVEDGAVYVDFSESG